MTLLEIGTSELREGSIAVLETERLILRAPRLGDAKVLAALANDKRIAENTRRIPHPYKRADADDFISAVNVPGPDGEVAFLITLRDGGAVIGACGIAMQDGAPDAGYWLGMNTGTGVTHRSHARGDRFRVHRVRPRFALGRHARHQSGLAAAPGKCRFQITSVGLCRIHAVHSSAPMDRFRLDRGL